ncbi:MAG: hypothetical protein ACLGI3_06575, partial [Actinomycetes bacterium]
MSTVFPAPSPGGHRPQDAGTGGAARRVIRRLALGSGPLKRTSDRIEVLSRLLLVVGLVMAPPVAVTV